MVNCEADETNNCLYDRPQVFGVDGEIIQKNPVSSDILIFYSYPEL